VSQIISQRNKNEAAQRLEFLKIKTIKMVERKNVL